MTVEEAIPEHVGLGSGTQLGLAVAAAMTRLHGLELDSSELLRRLDRGLRSGIGIGAFRMGGVLLDGGIGPDGG
ncbi:MAG: GHMP kinase, partial [Desulfuromonadales bacterium]|nr:GHMP kinase [Desulfuromonadales bacterium]NIS43281.1 GHMP kinase [Desulfuromonadales bacterium]